MAALVKQSKRVSRGRSKNGCQNCRLRKIKCDENIPSCQNCMKGGRDCVRPNISSYQGLATHPAFFLSCLDWKRGNARERELLGYYEHCIAPKVGGLLHQHFWSNTVLTAAQTNDGVWYAVLALSAMMELPRLIDKGLDITKYQKQALTWYDSSITCTAKLLARKPSQDKVEALLSSMLFFFIEREHGNRKSSEKLLQIAYSIVYEIENIEDITTAMCLPVLLDNLVVSNVDSTCVPQIHSEHAYKQALQWSTKSVNPKLYVLRIHLFALMHECQTFTIRGLGKEDYDSLLSRLQAWWQNMQIYWIEDEAKLQAVHSRLTAIRTAFRQTWVQFQAEVHALNDHICDDEQPRFLLEELEEFVHDLCDPNEDGVSAAIEAVVLPALVFLVWHVRNNALLERLAQALTSLKPHCPPNLFQPAYELIKGFQESNQSDEDGLVSDTPAMWQFFSSVSKLAHKPLPTVVNRQNILVWLRDDELK